MFQYPYLLFQIEYSVAVEQKVGMHYMRRIGAPHQRGRQSDRSKKRLRSALFRYMAKMAAVEYEKCPSIRTLRFDRFEYTIRVLSVHLFSPDLNLNALRTQTKASKYG